MEDLLEWLANHDFARHRWSDGDAAIIEDHLDHLIWNNPKNRERVEVWRIDIAKAMLCSAPFAVLAGLTESLVDRYATRPTGKIDGDDAELVRRMVNLMRKEADEIEGKLSTSDSK